jgi:adenylate cyclase
MPPDQAQGEQGCEMDEGHEFSGSAHIQSFSPEANPVTDRLARLSKWLTQEGRFLSNNRELLDKFCVKVVEAGVPLSRSWLHIRTLHPEFAGVSRIWRRGMQTQERFLDFGFEKLPAYLNSPVRHVVEQRQLCRWRLDGREALPFPVLEEHRTAGYVDYAIAPMVFSDGRVNALSWATDRPGGFSDANLRLFEEILPTYSTVVEVKSLRRFAVNVLTTYVGREPGELILNGQIRRGDVRTIKAGLMMVDLRDFTGLSDTLPPSEIIEALNHYFDCVIPPIKDRGGEVLEFLGDGILAILNENGERSARDACQLAFEAAQEGLDRLAALNNELAIPPRHLKAGYALHHGEVSYGNIGAHDRLDFTVIGPDVNLTSRIERLCRELDRNLLMSEDFVRNLDSPVLEIGPFRLRGFPRPQLVFGLPTN